jgi:hypothetical protein
MYLNPTLFHEEPIFFGEAFFRSLSVGLRYAPASSEAAEKRHLPSESSFVPSPVQFCSGPDILRVICCESLLGWAG